MKIVDPMGTEFDSIVSLCSFWGVSVKDFYQGASQGLSMDECLKYALDCATSTGDTKIDKSKKRLSDGNIVVDHTGQEFPSVSAMCEAYGVKYPTYNNRRRRGWSVERSLMSKVAEVVDHKGNTYKSIGEMCNTYGTHFTSFCRRRKAGWSLEECLLGKGFVEDHNGRSFKSITAMCKFYGVDPSSYKSRVKQGLSVEEALLGNVFDFEGNRYYSVNEMCEHWGISYSVYIHRVYKGWSQQDALTIKPKHQTKVRVRKQKDHLGNTYPTFKAMCDAYDLPSYLVRARLDRFKFSLEAALTTPKNKKGSTFRDKAQRREGVSFKKRGIFDSRPIMVDENE